MRLLLMTAVIVMATGAGAEGFRVRDLSDARDNAEKIVTAVKPSLIGN